MKRFVNSSHTAWPGVLLLLATCLDYMELYSLHNDRTTWKKYQKCLEAQPTLVNLVNKTLEMRTQDSQFTLCVNLYPPVHLWNLHAHPLTIEDPVKLDFIVEVSTVCQPLETFMMIDQRRARVSATPCPSLDTQLTVKTQQFLQL